jgi:hypothetical protein
MEISNRFGVVALRQDHGSAANLLIIFTDIPTENEANLMQQPAIIGEKKAQRIKNMHIVSDSVPKSGTEIRLAIIVMEETRLE